MIIMMIMIMIMMMMLSRPGCTILCLLLLWLLLGSFDDDLYYKQFGLVASPVTRPMSYEDYSSHMNWLRGGGGGGGDDMKAVAVTWDYYLDDDTPSPLTDSLWSDVFRSNGGALGSGAWAGKEENQHNFDGGSGDATTTSSSTEKETWQQDEGGEEDEEEGTDIPDLKTISSGAAISDHPTGGQDGGNSSRLSRGGGGERGGRGGRGGAGAGAGVDEASDSTTTTTTTQVMVAFSCV